MDDGKSVTADDWKRRAEDACLQGTLSNEAWLHHQRDWLAAQCAKLQSSLDSLRTLMQGERLEVACRERDEARAQLARLRRTARSAWPLIEVGLRDWHVAVRVLRALAETEANDDG